MNQREVFEKVREHLLKQGRPAKHGRQCSYRLGDLRCAVGCLVTDSAYIPEMEGKAVYRHPVPKILRISGVPTDDVTVRMLTDLQDIHDNRSPECWEQCLSEIKVRYFPEISTTCPSPPTS